MVDNRNARLVLQDIQRRHRSGGGVGAGPFADADLAPAAFRVLLRFQKSNHVIGLRQRSFQQLHHQHHQERVIGATGVTFGSFGVPTVLPPQRLQKIGDVGLPVDIRIGENINTGGDLQQIGCVEQRKEIDDRLM